MPVGKGSINRASRSSKKNVKEADSKVVMQPDVQESEAAVASVETKPARKKTVTKKAEAKEVVQESSANECCHLTEELPVHLL